MVIDGANALATLLTMKTQIKGSIAEAEQKILAREAANGS